MGQHNQTNETDTRPKNKQIVGGFMILRIRHNYQSTESSVLDIEDELYISNDHKVVGLGLFFSWDSGMLEV